VSGVTSGFPVRFPVRRRMWSRMPTST
jgi:hypothetical protein